MFKSFLLFSFFLFNLFQRTLVYIFTVSLYTFHLQVFRPRTPQEAIQLVSRLLEYIPSARISPLEACAHCFFDELREPATRLPNGRELPPLFNFTPQGKLFVVVSHVYPIDLF